MTRYWLFLKSFCNIYPADIEGWLSAEEDLRALCDETGTAIRVAPKLSEHGFCAA